MTRWASPGAARGNIAKMAVYDDGNGAALYGAGSFTVAGGSPANRIAKWDDVVGVAPTDGGVASLPGTALVPTLDDSPNRGRHHSRLSPDIEYLSVGSRDHASDTRIARHPAHVFRAHGISIDLADAVCLTGEDVPRHLDGEMGLLARSTRVVAVVEGVAADIGQGVRHALMPGPPVFGIEPAGIGLGVQRRGDDVTGLRVELPAHIPHALPGLGDRYPPSLPLGIEFGDCRGVVDLLTPHAHGRAEIVGSEVRSRIDQWRTIGHEGFRMTGRGRDEHPDTIARDLARDGSLPYEGLGGQRLARAQQRRSFCFGQATSMREPLSRGEHVSFGGRSTAVQLGYIERETCSCCIDPLVPLDDPGFELVVGQSRRIPEHRPLG